MSENLFRQNSSCFVLLQESIHGLHQSPRFLQDWEQKLFFEFLVIIFDKVMNDLRGTMNQFRVELLFGPDSPDGLIINEQDPVQTPVLSHQIFDWRNFLDTFCPA